MGHPHRELRGPRRAHLGARAVGPEELTADEVASLLGVGAGSEGRRYVEELGEVAPGFEPLGPFDQRAARVLCARLGLGTLETDDVLATLPSARTAPGWWWCVERAAARLVAHMGDPRAPRGTWPSWEGRDEPIERRCHFLHVALAVAPHTLAHHRATGVDGAVALSSLNDVARHAAIHRRVHGVSGMDAAWWVTLALRAELVELGRLQFNRFAIGGEESPPSFETLEVREGLRRGDECVGVHIPDGGPLEPQLVDDSLRQAAGHFGRHAPLGAGRRRRVATCRSWLLDPQLADYLPGESRILSFQRRFTLLPGHEQGDGDLLQFVFRIPSSGVDLDSLPRRTRLERAAVAHLRAGGHWHRRTGWLELPAS